MVLICGVPEESPVEFVADALEDINVPFMTISPRHPENFSLYFEIANGVADGELSVGNKSCLLSEVTGVYNRMVDFSITPEFRQLSHYDLKYQYLRKKFDLLNNWINLSKCRVLNFSQAMKSNCSKLYQMLLIKKSGFLVPDSIITNSPQRLESFYKANHKLIYKSASGVKSIVSSFSWDDRISLIENCPTLFQKCLTGINYRVHIVGKKVFATKILSDVIDYRYAKKENKKTTLQPFTLPISVERKCLSLSKKLNLPLAGIDLMQTDEGDWYCFEVNSSPGFSYYEDYTGQPISLAIASYLAKMDESL